MADYKFSIQAQLLPHCCPLLFVKNKAVQFNGIVEHPELRISIQPAARRLRAGTQLGRADFSERTQQILDDILFGLAFSGHRVIVDDAVRHPGPPGAPEREHAQRVHM